MPKIVIHGAGSIGCFVGGIWASRGLDITFLGRASLKSAIGEAGMALTDGLEFSEKIPASQYKVTDDPAALSDADLVALAVKCTGSAQAAAEIKAHAKAGTPVLSLQNGVSNVENLKGLLPDNPVIAGMVPFNVARLSDTHWHKGTRGEIIAAEHDILADIIAASAGSAAELVTHPDMKAVAWGKLLLNLNNAINALSGLTLKQELSQKPYRLVLAASIQEALDILEAANITPEKVSAFPTQKLPGFLSMPNFIFNTIGLKLQKIDDKARSSMADDFASRRQSEIDFLNGEVVALAKTVGMDAKINSRIVELVRAVDGGSEKRWSAEDLKQEVLG